MHSIVHSSIIYNNQDIEKMSVYLNVHQQMNKEDLKHSRILLTLKKEGNNAICTTIDGPRDDHTK